MPATTAGFKLAVFFIKVKAICNDGMMLLQISKRFYLMYVLINSYFRCMSLADFNKHWILSFSKMSLAACIETPQAYPVKCTALFSLHICI